MTPGSRLSTSSVRIRLLLERALAGLADWTHEVLPGLCRSTKGTTMNEFAALVSATGDTANLQSWIKGNIIPLLLLLIAVMLFVFAQRGDNAKAMRVVAGVVIALAVLGVATTGRADEVGTWLASLFTS